jgi:high-affinity K+ transport system ATPase subunit B
MYSSGLDFGKMILINHDKRDESMNHLVINIVLACIALIIIIYLARLVIGTVFGLIIMGVRWLFYAIVAAISAVVCFIFRKIGELFKAIYNRIRDRLYPDEGAYQIEFGPKNRKGTSRIKYTSIR